MQPQHIHPGKQLYPRSNIHAKREPRSACLNASSREDWTVLKARSRERRGRQGRGKPGGERAPRKSRRCGYSDSYRGTPSGKMWGAPHPLNKGRKVGSPHRSLSVQMSQLGVLARVTQKQPESGLCGRPPGEKTTGRRWEGPRSEWAAVRSHRRSMQRPEARPRHEMRGSLLASVAPGAGTPPFCGARRLR